MPSEATSHPLLGVTGNIMTPMVRKNFKDDPQLRELWEKENMPGRISTPAEYRGAALFCLSDASSFMTGSNLAIDGGYTAW
ncbi:alcohol dehydrogenase [Cladophialophora psammophila CBS 110553]|uniref:Alcohol dehydrogenase n=1 Tax=Cladophialophora psammophila CBS 110553 TaxID=1182543 RepID=W9WQ39_9EURO|nr:alcohol dehydrogenase [Cladophialophora psammophila CBS 110553]EXJ70023.1 alcohol dehydrogenase [Cladophialophora psammophila CBS 110553]